MLERSRPFLKLAAGMSLLVALQAAWAATDISQRPLLNNESEVKPNLMFVLDNSGSMGWEYLPDALGSYLSSYGRKSSQCNGAEFNPSASEKYAPPVTPDGRSYPNRQLTRAWADGFVPTFSASRSLSGSINTEIPEAGTLLSFSWSSWSSSPPPFSTGDEFVFQKTGNPALWISGTVQSISSSGSTRTITVLARFSTQLAGTQSGWTAGPVQTVDLTANAHYYTYTGSQPRMSWRYTSFGAVDTTSTFVNECISNIGNPPGSGVFSRVNVKDITDSEQQTKYANWYSYYRKRELIMRTAAGRAMSSLNANYRVGFSSLNDGSSFNNSVTNSIGKFAGIADFNAEHRNLFFSNLYSASSSGNGGTPLRPALAKAGQYFGGKRTSVTDPVQNASCQRNYTLLTTDGYWNQPTNVPKRLDNQTNIGNWDGDPVKTPAPKFDGSGGTITIERQLVSTAVIGQSSSCGSFFFPGPVYRHTLRQRKVETTVDGQTITGEWATIIEQGCSSSASTASTVSNSGASNTLADVAAYYHQAELSRPQKEPKGDGTTPKFPLMTTYTLGFGVDGLLKYSPDYQKQATGDFKDLTTGTKQWPVPQANDPSTVDDLWHAAVNGGGSYFSASEPQALTDALVTALKEIDDKIGAGAAAATSSLRPVLGTDQVFIGTYRTIFWDGNLSARTIKRTDQGDVIIGDEDWNAAGLLDVRDHTDRKIFFMRRQVNAAGTETRSLSNFSFDNLSGDADATALTSHFANFCSPSGQDPVTPAQCASLTSTQKTAANGANLVNFIRGDRSQEGVLYRKRSSLLGTIVDASPVVVGKPPFRYTDEGYNTFQSDNNARCPVVYTAANDGMLHAFSAATASSSSSCEDGGTELWAYIPRAVMGNLYRLGDTNYANRHQFFVNATPVVGDIAEQVNGKAVWSTLLVGGFGAGGRGYYALDVTDPAQPKAMWEFSDADMGLSYGNPIITKVPDSNGKPTWVVVFTSGLNNSGNGFLYVLNAHTGAVMYKIPTLVNGNPVGTASAPSGLNKLNAWIEVPTNNTALRFYAGDMLGNIWRFNSETAEQLAPPTAPAPDTRAFQLAKLSADGTGQPITVRPELVSIDDRTVVIVATGRYLGFEDLDDLTSLNSIYAIKDPLGDNPGWGDIRASDALVEQTLTTIPADTDNDIPEQRKVSNNSVNWATKAGWYLDLETADASERVVTNMTVLFDTLVVSSLVPVGDACSSSGYSWLYSLNINSGSYSNDQASDQVVGERVNNVIVGTNAVQIGRNTKLTTTNSDGSVSLKDGPDATAGQGGLRRTSWREILPSTD